MESPHIPIDLNREHPNPTADWLIRIIESIPTPRGYRRARELLEYI